ncbi:pentatricopeptide repeat-containing protein At2g27610 [Typha latifolia]|uniref:pentatricopeptide repeat-containing protein At2g27610 n=1 Tax=Typha latifolia TaxID=4733 RepID=UPI003C3098D2
MISRHLAKQTPPCQTFDKIPLRSSGSQCNHLLFQFARNNHNREALSLFLQTYRLGEPIDDSTLSCIVKICGSLSDRILGKQLHSLCVKHGYGTSVSVGTSLVDMYMKCDSIMDGRGVFECMPERNVVTWTSLFTGYTQGGFHDIVLELFFRMQIEGIWPNPFTFASVLAAAAGRGALDHGRRVHSQLIKFGYKSTVFVCNSLINMYSKCGLLEESWVVFEKMEDRDAVSWNAMMSGLVLNGHDQEALEHFYRMKTGGVKPTQSSFATVIKLCANLKQMSFAAQLHCCVVKDGFELDSNIMTALMVVYSKCSKLDDAFRIFSLMPGAQNVVSWTAIIGGFVQHGDTARAALLFSQMRKDSVEPNDFTFSILLTASPSISPFEVHAQVIKTNYQHVPSVGTALLAAYAKLGSTQDTLSVFKEINKKDIVAWSAMLTCYAQAGDPEGAMKLFRDMAMERVKPNEFTLSSAIDASASPNAAADQGRQFHAMSIKYRYQDAICVSSALVTMYSKKGSIESAQRVFERQSSRDLVSWNSMISGYAQHGYGKKALEIFREMEALGIEMDGITFIGVITACTHAGLVEEGRIYFNSMVKDHQISPTSEHYACMVDLYSRAGKLEEALDLIQGMPTPTGATVWRTLLAACRVHRNVELGKLAAEKLISLEPLDSAAYVLMSNIYAAAGRWNERAKVRKLMDDRKVKKEAGCSWIQVKNKIHSFVASDTSHPLLDKIYTKLEEMTTRLKEEGYCPDTDCVLHDMEEEQKEAMLIRHSERLALAFGLIATPQGYPLQIVKNLRVCGDCHTVIKLVSAIEGREIVVRDSNRFHHFKSGMCSCGDYW